MGARERFALAREVSRVASRSRRLQAHGEMNSPGHKPTLPLDL